MGVAQGASENIMENLRANFNGKALKGLLERYFG